MNEKRGFWYLLSGLILGLGIGLWVSWGLAPVQFVETTPASLSPEFRDDYRFMIAWAFNANNDLLRAQARLGTLQDAEPIKALGEQAQRMLAGNLPMNEVQLLADLSSAIQNQPTPAASPSSQASSDAPFQTSSPTEMTPLSQTPTVTLTPTMLLSPGSTQMLSASPSPAMTITATQPETATPKPISTIPVRPTQTVSPTPQAPFKLVKQSPFCDVTHPGLLEVYLLNANGKPAAGIELIMTWFNGEEHFFTGLKPELGNGYADFEMTESIEYALSLSAGSTRVTGLSLQKCANPQGGKYPGGIRLDFKQP